MRPESVDRLLPAMNCIEGCTDCCGIVACSQPEHDRLLEYANLHSITPTRQGSSCPWLHENRCSVYEARPTACRLYGHVEGMTCPHGRNVNVPLTIERRLMRDVTQEANAAGVVMLHSIVYSEEEIGELIEQVMTGEDA